MDKFQCYECGMISSDKGKLVKHMNASHNIKVEVDALSMKFSCYLCDWGTRNMNELKKHLINDHKKEEHNWMVGVITGLFTCNECEDEFPNKTMLETHMNSIHMGDGKNCNTVSNPPKNTSDDQSQISAHQVVLEVKDSDQTIECEKSLAAVCFNARLQVGRRSGRDHLPV